MKTKLQLKMKTTLLTGFIAVFAVSVIAQPLELNPSNECFVWETYPDSSNFNVNANHGDMSVQYSPDDNNSREVYMQFDLSEVKQIVTEATLTVRAGQKKGIEDPFSEREYDSVDNFYVELYACNNKNNEWTQEELTWNNKLPSDTYPLETFNVPPDGSVSFELSNDKILNYINGTLGEGRTNITFIFKAKDAYTNSRAWITNVEGWPEMAPTLAISSHDVDVTAEAFKDVFVNEADPDANYNDSTDMGILNAPGKSRYAYISFTKEGLPDLADEVYLQVLGTQKTDADKWDGYSYKAQPEFIVEVFGVHDHNNNNAWDETTLTWNSTQPGTSLIPLAEIAFTNTRRMYFTAKDDRLTNFFNRRMAHTGSENISFVLKAKYESDTSRVWISEKNWKPALLHASGKLRGSSVTVDDNVYVNEATPFSNYGDEGDMHVAMANGNDRIAYFKFDISGQAEADDVILSITGGQQGSGYMLKDSFMVELYMCEDKSWTEEAMVWQTRPALTGDALATVNMLTGPKQIAQSETFTSAINNAISSGDTSITLAIKAKYETFTATDSIRAWVWAGSSSLDFFYFVSNDISAPVFDPSPSVKLEDFTITLSTDTEGAEIYYTIDGSTPTTSSVKYNEPIVITGDMGLTTIRTIAIKDGARSTETTGDFAVADQKPYTGTPFDLPGTVYATQYDLGGAQVAYLTAASQANWSTLQDCRTDNSELNGFTGDNCDLVNGNLGGPSDGQWMEYTINVPEDITCYNLNVLYKRAPAGNNTGALRVEIVNDYDEVVKTLVDSFEFEQNCETWEEGLCDPTVATIGGQIAIPSGRQIVRVTHLGTALNFHNIEFVPASGCVQSVESNVNSKNVEIYPNPVQNNELHLSFSENLKGETLVRLYDIVGKPVFETLVKHNSETIHLPEYLKSGMYFLKIEGKGISATERIILE